MSRIYAGGNRATAVANIKADVAAYISFDASGRKVVDVDGLWGYLVAQGQAIITDAEYVSPATAATAAAAMKTINGRDMAQQLADLIGPQRWSSRPDWPTNTQQLTGGTQAAAVKSALAEVARQAAAVTAYYTDISNRLGTILTESYYRLGVDSAVPKGVERIIDSRFYRYTYVSDRGEESAPSPISALVEVDQNDTVDVTVSAPPSGRNITHYRPYRSNVGNDSVQFQYVPHPSDAAGWPIATLTLTDDKKATELREENKTLTWAEPPATLCGLTEGANGGMGGFISGSNIACFCVNYFGYAWPIEYRKTTAWPIVAMGSFDQTYVVLTRGRPYYMTGADSASLDSRKMDSEQACVSALSVVNVPGGVMYASADGICLADANGIRVITGPGGFDVFDLETWRALVPSSIVATYYEGCYLFRYNTGSVTGTYLLSLTDGKLVTADVSASAFYRDLVTDTVYSASGTAINALFAGNTRRTAIYKSPRIVLPAYASMAWAQADSDYASNVTVKSYGNGTLLNTATLSNRLPKRHARGRFNEWELQIEAAVAVTSATMASSTEEIKAV